MARKHVRITERTLVSLLGLIAVVISALTTAKPGPPTPILPEPTIRIAAEVPTQSPGALHYYQVQEVIDGDTVKVTDNGVVKTVRLLGIDTPETVDPRKPTQCFGSEASAYLKNLLEGHRVALTADVSQGDTDKYGRLLRYVQLEDGTDVNLDLVTRGYAYEYTYDKAYERQSLYRFAEKNAKVGESGLWSPATCNGKR